MDKTRFIGALVELDKLGSTAAINNFIRDHYDQFDYPKSKELTKIVSILQSNNLITQTQVNKFWKFHREFIWQESRKLD